MNTREVVHLFSDSKPVSDSNFHYENATKLDIYVYHENATKQLEHLGMLSKSGNLTDLSIVHHSNYGEKRMFRLPENIANLVNLNSIYIDGFDDLVIPKSIGELANLERLTIRKFSELIIPESIGNLKRLKSLSLEGRNKNFTKIILPSQIGKLENLERFELTKVQIKRLPKSFTNLSKLKYLFLNSVRGLKHLPSDIDRLQSLKLIDIDMNDELREIPQSIVELRNLEQLRVHCYNITHLPSTEAIQTIQHEEVRNKLMQCHERLEERQQAERKRAVGVINNFMKEGFERKSRKRITPKHLKKTLKYMQNQYGKKESQRMFTEATADELVGKYARDMDKKKFRERRKKFWRLNRGLPEQSRESSVESSATPELTPDDEEERREHWAKIEATKPEYDFLLKPRNSSAAEDAMDVVTSNNTSPASASSPVAAASKRERSSSEPGDWPVGINDNDNRPPPKQSRKQAWKGGKRSKRRNRK